MVFIYTINQAGEGVADTRFVFFKGNLLLGEHKLFESALFDEVRNLVREFGGGCSLFGVEGKATEVIEACPFDEIEQFVEAGIGFAWEADNEGGAEDAAGQFGS